MFTSNKAKELVEFNEFGSQTSNAIRVGRYFGSSVTLYKDDEELEFDQFFDYLFEDDIKYLIQAIDDELTRVNNLGQCIKVSPFQALCDICDENGILIQI